jgi:urease accessory protein
VIRVARVGGRSRVTTALAASPLRLLLPRNHGTAAWIFTSSYGGGLVGGDACAIDLEVAHDAAAFVSTQASTKVYRSPTGATAELRATVATGGMLVLAPDPVVPFAASRYRQTQHIDLEAGAGLVLIDWVTSGRRAAGERWAFDAYDATTQVRLEGTPIVHEALRLRLEDGDLRARAGRFDVLAFVLVAGAPLRNRAAGVVSCVASDPLRRKSGRLAAAAVVAPRGLGEVGCVVRVAGASVEAVGGYIRRLLAFVPDLLGDDPWERKW